MTNSKDRSMISLQDRVRSTDKKNILTYSAPRLWIGNLFGFLSISLSKNARQNLQEESKASCLTLYTYLLYSPWVLTEDKYKYKYVFIDEWVHENQRNLCWEFDKVQIPILSPESCPDWHLTFVLSKMFVLLQVMASFS